jgi:hypothetical protein
MQRSSTFALAALALAAPAWRTPAQVNVSSPVVVKDHSSSATGSAAPATASYMAGNSSGNLACIVACDSSALIVVSTATTSQIVALVSGN